MLVSCPYVGGIVRGVVLDDGMPILLGFEPVSVQNEPLFALKRPVYAHFGHFGHSSSPTWG